MTRYYLAYDTPVGKRPDGSFVMKVGRQEVSEPCQDAKSAAGICDLMLSIYGDDTHWIEDENGAKIYPNGL